MELKELLLETGIDLFSKKTYHSTGIREITKKAGVPTGSFHYYFKNKEDFALSVLDFYFEKNSNAYSGLLFDSELSAKEKLVKLFTLLMEKYKNETGNMNYSGCLIGSFGQDLANESAIISEKVKNLYDRMIFGIGSLIELGQSDQSIKTQISPTVLSAFIFDAFEGVLIRRKVDKTNKPFDDFILILNQL